MFHLGTLEIALILAAALLLFGPSRLPELGRAAGRFIAEFRGASQKVEKEVHETLSLSKKEGDKEDPPLNGGKNPALLERH